nr:uncharacterized protein LOC129281169 [Lytechinus pictus]
MLNSKNVRKRGQKGPLYNDSRQTWERYLRETRNMLMSMRFTDGSLVACSPRGTPIVGLCLAIDGIINLADMILDDPNSGMRYFLTYRLSQDHLEMHFGKIRGRGGWNNNPTALQFAAAYRALLLNAKLPVSKDGNVTSFLEALTRETIVSDEQVMSEQSDHEDNDAYLEGALPLPVDYQLNPFQENVTAYIAGYTVRKIQAQIYYCDTCKTGLEETVQDRMLQNQPAATSDCLKLIQIKNNGGLITPSPSVIQIAIQTEKIIRQEGNVPLTQDKVRAQLCMKVMRNLNYDNLFPQLHDHIFDGHLGTNHLARLIKDIVMQYLLVRIHFLSFSYSEEIRGQSIRNHLTRVAIFKNQ